MTVLPPPPPVLPPSVVAPRPAVEFGMNTFKKKARDAKKQYIVVNNNIPKQVNGNSSNDDRKLPQNETQLISLSRFVLPHPGTKHGHNIQLMPVNTKLGIPNTIICAKLNARRHPQRAFERLVILIQLHVGASIQIPPPKVFGKRSIIHYRATQPAKVGRTVGAFDLIAAPVLGDGDAAGGAGFGTEDSLRVFDIGAVGVGRHGVIFDAGYGFGVGASG
eukprot:CAMPEP_0184430088 /NCGR_PEP_ID=MMETSP0738-20130409/263452_1 /TAXON_ID=385413 /ORGANISM="Thalassiosira miniscula, Strain CCMP1093" /LENGTH=218 /DNA_ID=CAMNT_0026794565 /DNA_START=180 /DNA_END=835 /DNA_ORIENTATION=+